VSMGAYLRPLGMMTAALAALVIGALVLLSVWALFENRQGVVSAAVDRGACGSARHVQLKVEDVASWDSRELIYGNADCMAQIRRMLAVAPNFRCRMRGAYTACNHPLNSADSSTAVYAVIGPNAALLEVGAS